MGINKPPVGGGVGERTVQFGPSKKGMGVWSPMPHLSSAGGDSVVHEQAQQIARALVEAEATLTQAQIAERVGARYWGPRCLTQALRYAVANGLIRKMGRGTYAPPEMAPGEKKEAQ